MRHCRRFAACNQKHRQLSCFSAGPLTLFVLLNTIINTLQLGYKMYNFILSRSVADNNISPFNGLLSGTTQVSQYQKDKTNLDFTEARDSERQWHQLGHTQVCISLQTDNHASTPPLSFGMVICLERNVDLRMAQLMPLPLTVSCFLLRWLIISTRIFSYNFICVYPRSFDVSFNVFNKCNTSHDKVLIFHCYLTKAAEHEIATMRESANRKRCVDKLQPTTKI